MLHIPADALKKTLISSGFVSEKELTAAFQEGLKTERDLGDILIEKGAISENYLYQILAEYFGLPLVDLKREKIQDEVLRLLPEELARSKKVFAFAKEGRKIKLAMVDPGDLKTQNFLFHKLKRPLQIFISQDFPSSEYPKKRS